MPNTVLCAGNAQTNKNCFPCSGHPQFGIRQIRKRVSAARYLRCHARFVARFVAREGAALTDFRGSQRKALGSDK